MFRVNLGLFSQARPQASKMSESSKNELQKIHQLFTQIAHGFNPNQTPENVLLYREAVKLYESGHHASAEVVLKDALAQAKKDQCSDATISLYETQLKKIQEFVKSTEKTSKTNWWKAMLPALGGSSTVCLATGYYLGRSRAGSLIA